MLESNLVPVLHKLHLKSVVLFSPACASFDQFDNFEDRGDVFRALVGALRRIEGS